MLQFVKLGGSLITDKSRAYTARHEVIVRLAGEIRRSLELEPDIRLVVGHGSGSFGHWAAEPYGTREGVSTPTEWIGFAEVAAAAARLNCLVTDALLEAGVPVWSFQPSASARCHDGELVHLETGLMGVALSHGLVPLVYGDVALDDVRGGTIVSTEDLFVYLAAELEPDRILLLSEVAGVLGPDGEPVPRITPSSVDELSDVLTGARGADVTGGMLDKVRRMGDVAQRHPQTTIHILTGMRPGLLTCCLLGDDPDLGTRICSSDSKLES